jgi:hypothetical protein
MTWREYLIENVWTWAGTVMVLLTLTGSTLLRASVVTAIVVSLHLFLTAQGENSDDT